MTKIPWPVTRSRRGKDGRSTVWTAGTPVAETSMVKPPIGRRAVPGGVRAVQRLIDNLGVTESGYVRVMWLLAR